MGGGRTVEAEAWLEEVGSRGVAWNLRPVLTPPLSCSPKSEVLHYEQNHGDS